MSGDERPREAPGTEGMSNSTDPEPRGGMVSEVELVNGLPSETPDDSARGSWPPGSRGRREASRRALAEKADGPLPGSEDG